jgi:hypothetical protein
MMAVIVVTRLRLKDPALLDDFFTDALAAIEQAQKSDGRVRDWRGGRGSVSSPSPSNRACGSLAHGSPTFFTVGVRPVPARTGKAWGR